MRLFLAHDGDYRQLIEPLRVCTAIARDRIARICRKVGIRRPHQKETKELVALLREVFDEFHRTLAARKPPAVNPMDDPAF